MSQYFLISYLLIYIEPFFYSTISFSYF